MNRMRNTAAIAGSAFAAYALLRRVAKARSARYFEGRVVFITGGSRGLGLALAREFGRRGARVAIAARDEAHLERAGRMLAAEGIDTWVAPCDVRDRHSARRAIRACEEQFGTIDILVNNAGIIVVAPEDAMQREDYQDALDTHFWGAYNTTEAVLPSMRARRGGQIVNVSSVGGRLSVPHLLPYSVSKFALVGYSEGLRTELAARGIAVTTVCPGLMRTGSPRNAWFKGNHKGEYTWFMVSDTLPGLSVAAANAARAIVDATARRRASLDISLPARVATVAHAIAPSITARTLEIAARLLPHDDSPAVFAGAQSETGITESPLTALGRKAEERFNQR